MSIQYHCSRCSRPIEVDDALAGQAATCPYCGSVSSVPAASTYQPHASPLARAIDAVPGAAATYGGGGGAPTSGGVPAGMVFAPTDAVAARRARAARRFAIAAAICAGLTVAFFVVTLVVQVWLMAEHLNLKPGAPPPTTEQMIAAQTAAIEAHPLLLGLNLAPPVLAIIGLALGITSLSQSARGNWLAVLSTVVCGLFVLCTCGSALVFLKTGPPA